MSAKLEIHFTARGREDVRTFDWAEILIGRTDGSFAPDLDLSPDETVSSAGMRSFGWTTTSVGSKTWAAGLGQW